MRDLVDDVLALVAQQVTADVGLDLASRLIALPAQVSAPMNPMTAENSWVERSHT